MGAGEGKRASRDFTFLILKGAVLGLMIAAGGVLFLDRIIIGLGASRLLFPYCRDYLLIIMLFTPVSMLQVLFQNLIVTAGHPGVWLAVPLSELLTMLVSLGYFVTLCPVYWGERN